MTHDTLFQGRTVLITGGLGFIGSNLARYLVALGADVTVIDSLIPEYGGNTANVAGIENQIAINISDVRDEHSMKYLVQGKDYLFNLAGQTSHLDSMQNPFVDLEINARAQLSILEACRHHNPAIRIVFASTRQVYGRPERLPVGEDHPIRPVDVNGINKMSGECYHILYHDIYGIPTTVLRLTNTYGPGMRVKDARQTFLGIWIKRLLDGEPIMIYGDGSQRRDLNYVDDVVEAFLCAAVNEKAIGQVYNLGSEEIVSLKNLAAKVVSINGGGRFRCVPFPEDVKQIDIGDYFGDFSRIRNDLGWKPRILLQDGLELTLNYYREHGGLYWTEERT